MNDLNLVFTVYDELRKENHVESDLNTLVNNVFLKVENSTKEFLSYFNRITNRKAKKHVQRLLFYNNFPVRVIYRAIQDISNEILGPQTEINVNYCINLFNFIYFVRNTTVQISDDAIEELFMLCLTIFGSLTKYSNDIPTSNHERIMHLANLTSKQLVVILNEHQHNPLIEKFARNLVFDCIKIFSKDIFAFDLKIKSGLIFVHALNALPQNLKENFTFQHAPSLDLLQNAHLLPSDSIKVVIYSSILNILPVNSLINIKHDGKCLFTGFYEALIECALRSSSISSQIIEVSRVLLTLAKHLHVIQAEAEIFRLFQLGLVFVWLHMEHFIDTVRNYAKLFFIELIQLACNCHKDENAELMDILIRNTSESRKCNSVRFVVYEAVAKHISCSFLLEKFPKLYLELLELCLDETIAENACKTYIILLEKHFNEVQYDDWLRIWIKPVAVLLKLNVKSAIYCKRILFASFQLKPTILNEIFSSNYIQNTEESKVLLSCLQFARLNDVQIEKNADSWRGLIKQEHLNVFQVHQDEDVRISVLALIVDTRKTTEPFQLFELSFLLSFLYYNITSQSPNIRKQLLTYYTRALSRVEASSALINRSDECADLKPSYQQFLTDFYAFLLSNLAPDANHFRRSITLELLLFVSQSNKPIWDNFKHKNEVFYNFLADSYEVNKQLAVELILKLDMKSLEERCDEFIEMAMDIRPSRTLTAAYTLKVCKIDENIILNKLVFKLRDLCERISESKDFITCKTSLYGLLLCIRHLIPSCKQNKEFYGDCVAICWKIREKIMPIVCSPSPEGYLPTETDESSKSQMILVYAWRTMKEMTLLLAEIVAKTIDEEESEEILEIGRFFIEIFYQSKHRGVFEQAHVGFTTISQLFWMSQNKVFNKLPKEWLENVLGDVVGVENSVKLCPTRRSAGLPFMILSLIITEPGSEKVYFHKTMETLLKSCENPLYSTENHIHSMNILRALIRHSKLGELVTQYIERAVKISILGFKNAAWGVRNSSTLLYSSLITRIFGVQRTHDSDNVSNKNRLTIRVFFTRYPNLYNFLLEQLEIECKNSDSMILHPILMILARLYPSKEEFTMENAKYLEFVEICMENPVLRTRELAARASVPLISTNVLNLYFEKVFGRLNEGKFEENTVHGLLLQVWQILSSTKLVKEPPLEGLTSFLQQCHSELTIALFCDVFYEFLHRFEAYDNLEVLKIVFQQLIRIPHQQNALNLIIYIVLNKFEENHLTYTLIGNKIVESLHSECIIELKYALEILIQLNMRLNKNIMLHPLFFTKEFEFSTQIKKLVDSLSKECCEKLLISLHNQVSKFLLKELQCLAGNSDERALLLILLNYYPCIFNKLDENPQLIFKKLLILCKNCSDEIVSSLLSCLSTFLHNLNSIKIVNSLDFDLFVEILRKNAAPASVDHCRLAVCNLLQQNGNLFYQKPCVIENSWILCDIFNVTVVLLEDDELFIRNAMSNVFTSTFDRKIPETSKECLFTIAIDIFPKQLAVSFLFSWACRFFPDYTSNDDENEIFERGELNLFAENIANTRKCVELLSQMFSLKMFDSISEGFRYLVEALESCPQKMMSRNVVKCLRATYRAIQAKKGKLREIDVVIGESMDKCDQYYVKKVVNEVFNEFLINT